MLGLAEKIGFVGGDGVDEVLALLAVAGRKEIFGIPLQRLQPQVAHAAQQAALHHGQLRLGHLDP
jgi:hypothetical protein